MKTKQSTKQVYQIGTDKVSDAGISQETKFDLYVQSRRVNQLSAALDKIAFNTQNLDSFNVIRDQEFVDELLDELLDDSLLVLDGIQLDGESMDLSLKLMSNIKRAIGVLQQVATDRKGQVN